MIELIIHRWPMKTLLRVIARKHSIYTALDAMNKEWGTDYKEEDIIKWEHISEENAIAELKKLNSEQGVQVSDTTEVK